jgi:hypothetical protein
MAKEYEMDDIKRKVKDSDKALNRDPITGAPGAHPVGTGAGAVSGGVAGAAVGMAGGPVGAAVGGVVGAVAGGLAGKGVAEMVNPTKEEAYWRETYVSEPYFKPGKTYDYYAPGYRIGWEGRARYEGRKFEDVESKLRADYERSRSQSNPDWDQGRLAAKAAWDRIDDITINSR